MAAMEMQIDDSIFYLRPAGKQFPLVQAIGSNESREEQVPLVAKDDLQFINHPTGEVTQNATFQSARRRLLPAIHVGLEKVGPEPRNFLFAIR
jgi:hypothetical protein